MRTVTDNKGQEIHLQKVHVNGLDDNVLLVNSEAKALKEASMDSKASSRYEEGLDAIKKGIEGKGTKKRDKVNRRLGRLNQRCPGLEKRYTIEFTYNDKDVATAMTWRRNQNACAATKKMHGKYFLQTSLDENREENIWQFYNVIRTVEETFKTLKLDLDIRPIYHKSDKGTKAHLHLAILAYWVVSVTKYMLKKKGINMRWSELLRIMSAQQRVTIVAEQTGRTTTQGAAMHGPGEEARGHPERPRHPCQTYLLNKICVAPEITIRRRPQL